MEFSEDLIPQPYKKPHDLKKGLESLCFDGCYQTCLKIKNIFRHSRSLQDKLTTEETTIQVVVIKYDC